MTDPDAPHGTAEDLEAQQAREWTTYVARVAIDFYGTRAYNRGDPVPVSAVAGPAAWISAEWVEETAPFTGSATVPGAEPPPIDPARVAAPPAAVPDPGSAVTSTED